MTSHERDVKGLLSFWFGEGRTCLRHSSILRDRWFASGRQQEAVDRDVSANWGERVLEINALITHSECGGSGKLESSARTMVWVNAWRRTSNGSLALVILLDQFARHVERHRRRLTEHNIEMPAWCSANVNINMDACSRAARAEVLLAWKGFHNEVYRERAAGDRSEKRGFATGGSVPGKSYISECSISPLPLPPSILPFHSEHLDTARLVFLLMPFRHGIDAAIEIKTAGLCGGSLDDRRAQLRVVLRALDARDEELQARRELVQRFRKQTLRSLSVADDVAKAPVSKKDAKQTQGMATDEKIGCDRGGDDVDNDGADLLERIPFSADESSLREGMHPLLRTLDTFLGKSFETKRCSSGQFGASFPLLVLSLSGGVDSMVLLKVLSSSWLRQRHANYSVLSLHVNYGNRPEVRKG